MSELEPEVPSKEELLDTIEETSEAIDESVEVSTIEQEAIEHGWKPEGVEGKLNLSAEEFMDRQKLYDDIRGLKKQNRRLTDGIEAMKEFQSSIRASERERVIRELTEAKKYALENEDYDTVVNIDDRITQARLTPVENKQNAVFEEWVDNNEWYHQDSEMKKYADMIGTGYYQQNPGKDMSEVYNYVTQEVKKRFYDKFGNPKREKPNPVEGASRGRARTSKQYSAKDLPEQDRQMMKTIVRSGVMTEQEYLKQYFS